MSAKAKLMRRSLISLLSGSALAAVLAFADPVVAQTGKSSDLIDKLKGLNEVQAQKLEGDVRAALADYQKLAGSNPGLALERLQQTLAQLQADKTLTPGRRDLLTRQVRDRIKLAQVEADRAAQRTATTNDRLARTDAKGQETELRAAEVATINRTLAQITDLHQQGKTAEATKLAEDLFQRYPHLAAPQAVGQTTTILGQVAYLNQVQQERALRRNEGLNAIERSALMPGSDVEFPKDWATRIAKRESSNLPAATAKEKAIIATLEKEISVNYKNVGFIDAIEHLSTLLNQPILLDKNALNDALVTSETQANLVVKGVKARTVLRKLLADAGLAYIVKDEVIQVVTEKQAKETLVTKTYYLGGLLAGGPFTNAGIRFFPGITQFEAMQNVLSIVQMIQNTVDPQSWQANGGQGTISFHAPSMSLTIRNTAEVHSLMGGMTK